MADQEKPTVQADFIQGALASIVTWFAELPNGIKWIAASFFLYLVFCMVAQIEPTALFKGGQLAVIDIVQHDRKFEQQSLSERVDYIGFLREQLNSDRLRLAKIEEERLAFTTNIATKVIEIDERLKTLEERHRKIH